MIFFGRCYRRYWASRRGEKIANLEKRIFWNSIATKSIIIYLELRITLTYPYYAEKIAILYAAPVDKSVWFFNDVVIYYEKLLLYL